MNERDIIAHITSNAPHQGEGVVLGVGDDCAVIEKDGQTVWLLTMDTLVEGVHFDRRWHPPEQVGRKSIAVNVSDIAAMGGAPRFILLSAGLPESFDQEWFTAFSNGVAQGCRDYGALLVGGDTVRCPGGFSFTVTVIGEILRERVLYRSNAQNDDDLWVSGYLGQAAAGLALFSRGLAETDKAFASLLAAHLDPQARVKLGQQLAATGQVNAMMDLSDGLATDLAHLCQRSGVRGEIIAARLPVSEALAKAADILNARPLSFALSGGEDYELLFTAPAEALPTIEKVGRQCGVQLFRIGNIRSGDGVVLLSEDEFGRQTEQAIAYQGFDHFRS